MLSMLLAHEEELAPIIMPVWAFPAIAAVAFVVIGLVSWSYRDVANRHANQPADTDSEPAHSH